jgi:hypothetical protein
MNRKVRRAIICLSIALVLVTAYALMLTLKDDKQSSTATTVQAPSPQEIARAYAFSPEREEMYEDVFGPASELVAEAMLSGELGTINISAPQGDVEGWGSIQFAGTEGADAHVSVFFRSDGSVDLSKGVRYMGLDFGDDSRGVTIMRPEADEPWVAFIESYDSDVDQTTDISYIGSGTPIPGDFRYPVTVREVSALDREILDVLTGIMNETFGTDWNNE